MVLMKDSSLATDKLITKAYRSTCMLKNSCKFDLLMRFTLQHTDTGSKARAGILHTAHGDIETPIFMPVGTAGSVKAVHLHELTEAIKAQIILGNTYHLYLRPGLDVISAAGGLHGFTGWQKPILTDSGGYQVYSLKEVRKLKEEGVIFKSHIDGSKHTFTPENVVDVQRVLGSDIMMVLDECTPFPCDYTYASKSLDLTHRWLQRGIDHFRATEPLYGHEQALFPIVQGSVYKDLRQRSAETIAAAGCDGNAIGGLSVGEPHDMMYEMTDVVCSILPTDKPRYLMGVGTPANILECIALGIDMFDCVMPTRNARNGWLFTQEGVINIKNEKWKTDLSVIDENAYCYADLQYTKAYLRHLFVSREILGAMIATLHNLSFYLWLVGEARRRIIDGSFADWKSQMVPKLSRRV